jgi:hypothetical protein
VKRTFVLVLAVFAFAGPATAAAPAKQAVVPGFFQGKTITYYDFGPIKLQPGNKVAPIWAVTNGAAGQHNIIDTVPGMADYSPLWQLNMVTFKSGVTPHLLRSKADVVAAGKAGEVTVAATTTVVNCPVLGFGQKKVAGYSGGHVIHYLDLGPVKVAPTSPGRTSPPARRNTRRSGESSRSPSRPASSRACSPPTRKSRRPRRPAR